MKMNRKILILLAALVIISEAVFAQTEADFNVTLTNDSKGAVITGYTGTATAVRIPATIQGMPVREIGKGVFVNKITSVVIPEGVTIIRESAFSGATWAAVRQNIASDKLVQVTLPSTLQIIEKEAFSYNAALKSIVIPNGVTEIGESAFANCTTLASVTFPKSLAKLGHSAFTQTAITSITLPSSLTKIVAGTFAYTKLTSIVIPEGVTEINNEGRDTGAFANCVALTSVTFPSTIKKIVDNAFENCSNLTTVTIPESVVAIDITDRAFNNCGKLSLASQAAIKKCKEAWVAAQAAAKQAAEAERIAAREAEQAAREAERKKEQEAREAERKAEQAAKEAREAELKAEQATMAEVKSQYDNLLKKAGELQGTLNGLRAYSKAQAKTIIRDSARKYVALLSEVAEFKKRYPQISEQSLDYYTPLSNSIGSISSVFQYKLEENEWNILNKKELDDFRKEFPSIFNNEPAIVSNNVSATNTSNWDIWRDDSSTTTLNKSIAADGICTVTVGGTPEKHGVNNMWNAWKITAALPYTGNAGKRYEYKFEAWTQSGNRNLHIEYYWDNNASVYLNDTIRITTTRKTYTLKGKAFTKSGEQYVRFQLADQLGTVYIKMLEIKEIR